MKCKIVHNGTLVADQVVKLRVNSSCLVKIKGSAFSANIQSADENIDSGRVDRSDPTEDTVYSDLTPIVTLTEAANYTQTLGPGFYALKFASSTGTIVVTVTGA